MHASMGLVLSLELSRAKFFLFNLIYILLFNYKEANSNNL